MHEHQHDSPRSDGSRRFRIPGKWVLVGFLVVAGYFLATEHRAHAIQFLPFLFLLACPLMHMFHGHDGHGGHGGHRDDGEPGKDKPPRRERTEGDSQ